MKFDIHWLDGLPDVDSKRAMIERGTTKTMRMTMRLSCVIVEINEMVNGVKGQVWVR